MNLTRLLDKRDTIYGFCAIWIVLFHTFRRISMSYIPVITNIISNGNMGVDIFFFFSGLCLALSAKKHKYVEVGWEEYYKRRFYRVVVPYLIICIPYYLWNALAEYHGSTIKKIIYFGANFSSATFWIRGIQTTWFVYAIIVFYLLFPLLFRFILHGNHKRNVILLVGIIVLGVLSAYIPIIKNSMIVWARLPIFTIGIMMGVQDDKCKCLDNNLRLNVLIAIAILVVLGWLTSMIELSDNFTIPRVYRFLIYIPMTLAIIYLLSVAGGKVKAFEWIGGFSLEIYLIHITLLHPFDHYGILEDAGYWMYIILPVTAVFLAWIVILIEKLIQRKQGV